ncbi:MAG: diguanylate cyclase [Synechococcales cyanobacterium CRU_2_2]|nr:diguanylate cyclase [Synechococcales cyanobacterium CRU_2_2]
MDHSILIVGSRAFHVMVQSRVHPSIAMTHAKDSVQAGLSIQARQPDLIVVQADDLELATSTLRLKARGRFCWIYALALSGRSDGTKPDIHKPDTHKPDDSQDWAAQVIVLLKAGADVCLSLESTESTPSPQEMQLLETQLQVGISAAKRYRELLKTNDLLSTIALVDPLTELSNRRALDWELPRQIERARDRDRPLSLMIFDLDFFKSINDTHGHLVGDVSLKLLSARLRHNLRANDTLFRYGGEEFVVILSDTQGDEAGEIGDRLCQLIGTQAFTINDDLELSLTVSVGVAVLRPEDDTKGLTLMERADRRLRQAKQTGRNRVVTGA